MGGAVTAAGLAGRLGARRDEPWFQPTLEALGDLDALPSWLEPIAGPIWLSPSTLWIVDGVGRHLGNVMVATVHGMRWNVGPNRARTNYRNQPVVTDRDGEDHNPLEGVTVVASRNLEELRNNGPESPRDYYEMRAAYWRSVEPGATTTADSAASTASTTTTTRHLRDPHV